MTFSATELSINGGTITPCHEMGVIVETVTFSNMEPELMTGRVVRSVASLNLAQDDVLRLYVTPTGGVRQLVFTGAVIAPQTDVCSDVVVFTAHGLLGVLQEHVVWKPTNYPGGATALFQLNIGEELSSNQLYGWEVSQTTTQSLDLLLTRGLERLAAVGMTAAKSVGTFAAGQRIGQWVRERDYLFCLQHVLMTVSDAFLGVDHSTTPPTIRVGRFRDQVAAAVDLTAPPWISAQVRPRTDMDTPGIVFWYPAVALPLATSAGGGGYPHVANISVTQHPGTGWSREDRRASVFRIEASHEQYFINGPNSAAARIAIHAELTREVVDGMVTAVAALPLPRVGDVLTVAGKRLNINVVTWRVAAGRVDLQCGTPQRVGVETLRDVWHKLLRGVGRGIGLIDVPAPE